MADETITSSGKIDTAPVSAPKGDFGVFELEQVLSGDELNKDEYMNYNRVDQELAKYATATGVEISEEDNSRLKKMIDRRVLVVMVVTYFLQALDKGTLSFSSIMGIQTDLHLHGQQYSWLTTCIYIAILITEYPQNYIIARVPIGKYLGINIILWSITLALHSVAKNFTDIVVLRTLLGIFEAVCQPTFVIMSAMWYKRQEQTAIVTFWYMMNGMQQIIGGLLAYCFTLIKPGGVLKSWQALFLTYGCISVCWGIFVLWWLPDSPMKAKCFNEEDKALMVERVRSNQTGLQNKVFRKEQLVEALTDVQTWCYCGVAMLTTLPTSGLGGFANIIIKGFGFTVLQTQLLAMVLGAFIIIVLLSSTWIVKKTGQNVFVMMAYCAPAVIGTTVLMTVRNTSKATEAGLLFSYYICLSFWAASTLNISMISRNVAGQTKKSVVVAMHFIFWAAGNSIGPQVFLSWDAPRYFIAFSTHMGCYALLFIDLIILRWYLVRQNRKRDELAVAGVAEADPSNAVHGFEDLTDKANLRFRYMY